VLKCSLLENILAARLHEQTLSSGGYMSSPSLGRLLISHITLRGPELGQLYACIADSPGVHYNELVRLTAAPINESNQFGLQEAALRETLNFLLVAQLVEQYGPARRQATFRVVPNVPDIPFPLLLMSHIATHPDERQRAIVTLYQQLARQDVLALTASGIRDEAERGPLGDLFAWTGEKVVFWVRLCEYLGLMRSVARDNHVLLAPRPELILAALRVQFGDRSGASLATCLTEVDASFFACFTARGAVQRGLAQTLVALHRLGALRLSHSSDAAQSLTLGEWRVSDIEIPKQPRGLQ
jgi:hypothetical protein